MSKTGLSQARNEKRINNEMTDWAGLVADLTVPPQLNSLCLTVDCILYTISYWPAKCFLQNTNTDVERGREGGREGEGRRRREVVQ